MSRNRRRHRGLTTWSDGDDAGESKPLDDLSLGDRLGLGANLPLLLFEKTDAFRGSPAPGPLRPLPPR